MIVVAFGPTTASRISRYRIDPIPAYAESCRAKKAENFVRKLTPITVGRSTISVNSRIIDPSGTSN
ncbi:hypothetical protein HSBAA_PA_0970 (plasmid) [Vreelandella sulfidaeris]|uniref:Uncharacterized protein n=1 Tax=Vreelandella sulfidaeris TaxID=115553 RepID=A0A455URJ8_9GAMM|nr:hypothetical protein HSBAA_PA_0970 [Halomonas sulfidaeris]